MNQDPKLVSRIKHALENGLQEDAMDINVEVKSGNVHLSGMVDNLRDKAQAQHIANRFEEVSSIENNITIAMDGNITDYQIKKQIEEELQQSNHREALRNIGVEVNGGAVTLMGQAESLAQEITAFEIIRNVKGVKNVASSLNIGPTYHFDDISLGNQISQAFSNSILASDHIDVSVSHGIATLSGVVQSEYNIELAGEIAAHTEGVQKIKNQLTKVHQ